MPRRQVAVLPGDRLSSRFGRGCGCRSQRHAHVEEASHGDLLVVVSAWMSSRIVCTPSVRMAFDLVLAGEKGFSRGVA
jgi:hypothetical protein